jgi:hypothetical protein
MDKAIAGDMLDRNEEVSPLSHGEATAVRRRRNTAE